jgi:hypothetical protein
MSVSRVFEALGIRIGGSEGSEGVIRVSLFSGRYADAAGDMALCCEPVGANRGAVWNESDKGPITEPSGISEQDLRKVQNCRSEL